MERKRISAKEAANDIRSGMDDSSLMKKYRLSPEGLQSLYDKLVSTGFIDLGDMQRHLSGFVGSVVINEADLYPKEHGLKEENLKSEPVPIINAREAARDIRSGMDGAILMEKYRLSPKGLKSLLDKLLSLGLLTEQDHDRSHIGIDDRHCPFERRNAHRQ